MEDREILQLLNEGTPEELREVRGIGPALAAKIVEARPFSSVDDLLAVRGFSAKRLERIEVAEGHTPLRAAEAGEAPEAGEPVETEGAAGAEPGAPAPEEAEATAAAPEEPETLLTPPTEESVGAAGPEVGGADNRGFAERVAGMGTAVGSTLSKTGEAARDGIKDGFSAVGDTVGRGGRAARDAVKSIPDKVEHSTRTRGVFGTVLASSLITLIITLALALAVLGTINGSLKFATGSQYRSLEREVTAISTQVENLRQDVDGLRARVDTLETLGERTVVLEDGQRLLEADLAEVRAQADEQEERTQRFEDFLRELRNLISGLFDGEGGIE
jgi:hypothetical protein